MKAKVGDWIRFRWQGHLVIGLVSYVDTKSDHRGSEIYHTDQASCSEEDVLEKRSPCATVGSA